MLLQVEDGAMTKEFRVLGHADRVDESLKRSHASGTKVGGPASIPADFKPKITFVDENALKEGKDGDNGGTSKFKSEGASIANGCRFRFLFLLSPSNWFHCLCRSPLSKTPKTSLF